MAAQAAKRVYPTLKPIVANEWMREAVVTGPSFTRTALKATLLSCAVAYGVAKYLNSDVQRRKDYNVLKELEDNQKYEILKANIAAYKAENDGAKPSENQLLKWIKMKKGVAVDEDEE
eukprot:gb/GEZN01026481.1/.p1 GENE.gb/GEZN01026481.1/~~gb/GEZN01026481.1/.p1  ORF type:complete len:126 (-),score=26.73 gb/GEZN01026481.1/:143-496(-)